MIYVHIFYGLLMYRYVSDTDLHQGQWCNTQLKAYSLFNLKHEHNKGTIPFNFLTETRITPNIV